MLAILASLASGIAGTTQGSVNNRMREKIGSTYLSTLISFAGSVPLVIILVLILEGGLNIPLSEVSEYPFWIWGGGICGDIIVALGVVCIPKLGSAKNIIIVCLGQIIISMFIDNFGLFGTEVIPMSITRLVGAAVVIAGVILVTAEKGGSSKSEWLYVMLAVLSGALCGIQVAINGTLGIAAGSGYRATLISQCVGFLGAVAIVVFIRFARGKEVLFDSEPGDFPFKWWMATGGAFAIVIVGGNAIAASILGTGIVTVLNTAGMMAAGLVIDAVGWLGIKKKPITMRKIAGMILVIAGTAVIMML